MKKLSLALAAAGLLGFAAGSASAAQLSQQDETFVQKAAQTNLAEIQAGQMAEQKGTTSAVKQLGQTMVADHTTMNNELKQLAQQQGFSVPSSVPADEKQKQQQLQKLSGAQFDQQFAKEEVEDHRTAIQEFMKEAQTTQDPALRQFAQSGIPALQKHLQMAQQAQAGG